LWHRQREFNLIASRVKTLARVYMWLSVSYDLVAVIVLLCSCMSKSFSEINWLLSFGFCTVLRLGIQTFRRKILPPCSGRLNWVNIEVMPFIWDRSGNIWPITTPEGAKINWCYPKSLNMKMRLFYLSHWMWKWDGIVLSHWMWRWNDVLSH